MPAYTGGRGGRVEPACAGMTDGMCGMCGMCGWVRSALARHAPFMPAFPLPPPIRGTPVGPGAHSQLTAARSFAKMGELRQMPFRPLR
jgi:hypothetical protein